MSDEDRILAPMIKKLLVANRGEIALRIMRSAAEMGIENIAIFSEADRKSPHVRFADKAVCVGPPPSAESYLNMERILEAAKAFGADAIHPGYGFLSENAAFATMVTDAGLIWVGPPPEAIEIMGSKLAAKAAVSSYDVPMVPGFQEAAVTTDQARQMAAQIGYPVLIKASAGGGGKGMRIVESEDKMEEQMQRAQSEARSAFGDDSVFVEKFFPSARHIEIQVLGDKHGNLIHLFERDCSIQRRHQKVIEEAPSAVMTPELRDAMGHSALEVARACNYYGAGTVEFLVDEKLNYYFLEMNTRLQVEHPVTEKVTGVDLVREMLHVAEGRKLTLRQEDLEIRGHAIELRVYAEDPYNNFLPDIGKLVTYRRPQGLGIRVDDGFEEGMEMPIFYDPMIAKLIIHGEDRERAITKMLRAISEYRINGLRTTLAFGAFAMDHEAFRSGNFDTNFVQKYFRPELMEKADAGPEEAAVLLAAELFRRKSGEKGVEGKTQAGSDRRKTTPSAWVKNRS